MESDRGRSDIGFQNPVSDSDYLKERLKVAKTYFAVFSSPRLNKDEFRSGKIQWLMKLGST
jgi:hypothetical protein